MGVARCVPSRDTLHCENVDDNFFEMEAAKAFAPLVGSTHTLQYGHGALLLPASVQATNFEPTLREEL